MRELEGLSYAELAGAHDVSVPAVKSLLVRARMSLVQAAEARDTTCTEIRSDLALAHGRGVRANGRARRHLRDCDGCREYRQGLRQVQRSLGALAPASGTGAGLLAKLGIGGSGSAAAGGGAASGTGLIGGTAATVTAGKVCAVVCSVALTAGGAVEVQHEISDAGPQGGGSAPAAAQSVRSAGHPRATTPATDKPANVIKASAQDTTPVTSDPAPTSAPTDPTSQDSASTGGAQAPADLANDPPADSAAPDKPKAEGAGSETTTTPPLPLGSGERSAPPTGGGSTTTTHS